MNVSENKMTRVQRREQYQEDEVVIKVSWLGEGGVWVAQLVKPLTSAQIMISGSMGSSPALGSVPKAQSLYPASDSVSPSLFLSAPPQLSLCLSRK